MAETGDVSSHNFVAKLEGSDPRSEDEYLVYSAHHRSSGHRDRKGDSIYNGALDHASGSRFFSKSPALFQK